MQSTPTSTGGNRARDGYVLLVSLSLLGLLGALGTLFVNVAGTERRIAACYLDQVRARALADSGLEYGWVAVREADLGRSWSRIAGTQPDAWYFRGEDANLNFRLDDGEDIRINDRLDGAALPLEDAPTVSFHLAAGPDGAGYSVALGGTYEPHGDVAALKVVDCASRINVNNFDLPGEEGNAWLPQILNRLGELVNAGTEVGTDLQNAAARGAKFTDIQQLREILGEDRYAKVAPFVTCRSWVDSHTISLLPAATTPRRTPRAPVNVNTASIEVLTAVLWGISGSYSSYDYDAASLSQALRARTVEINRTEAENLARFILDQRGAFYGGAGGYFDWMHFKLEILNAAPGLTRAQRDLLYAALNPNTNFKKRNPDLIGAEPDPDVDPLQISLIDKFDVTQGGTEFCFGAMGYYEIEAHGRVYRDRRVVAEHRIRAVARVSETLRLTTQKQFERNRVWSDPSGPYGNLHDGGNVPVVSLPEYPFNTDENGPRYRSIGADPYGGTLNDVDWCADWDGGLMLNGLATYTLGKDDRPVETTRRSLFASFGRGTLKSDFYPVRGISPGYAYQVANCERVDESYYPLQTIADDDLYLTGKTGETERPNASAVLVPAPLPAMVDAGHDLTAFGIYVHSLRRKRFHTYFGDEMPAPEATVEFLVKPEVDIRQWGRAMGNECKQMVLCDWGPIKTDRTNYEIRIFTSMGRVFADFIWKRVPDEPAQHYLIFGDADWPPHTWHHVELNFSERLPGGDPCQPNAILFIDGNPANGFGGSGKALQENVLALPAPVEVEGRGTFTAFKDPWLVFGGAMIDVGGVESMARSNFIGTLDNLGLHWWRQHDAAFVPKSRYHDPSYRAYGRSITYEGVGTFDVGVYLRRMKEVEDALETEGGPVTLGTLSCTHVHPYHEHFNGGHGGPVGAFGHLTPRVMIEDGGATLYYSNYDGCAGVAIADPVGAGVKNHVLRPGNKLYLAVEFEVADTLPVNASAVLDDVTLTYSTGVHVLSRVVPD